MKLYFKCSETHQFCDKKQYNENGFFDGLRLKLHLLVCKICRDYSKRNGKLTSTIESANIKTLPNEQKELLKSRLAEELKQPSGL